MTSSASSDKPDIRSACSLSCLIFSLCFLIASSFFSLALSSSSTCSNSAAVSVVVPNSFMITLSVDSDLPYDRLILSPSAWGSPTACPSEGIFLKLSFLDSPMLSGDIFDLLWTLSSRWATCVPPCEALSTAVRLLPDQSLWRDSGESLGRVQKHPNVLVGWL
eukprot:CAMPEP_0169475938 /NCGR_PEP_ID=MMETSP1042-20121227/27091_1 /TAXON_ID=464988 /ORGANISM="Hemiselmis andersenii, Strain CCMP1180" /LENGTH=162 /DNA_ID=CAMNT_0009590137 /DNA_START=48 /DNA_END=536 /DNA_ORIENTATION=-